MDGNWRTLGRRKTNIVAWLPRPFALPFLLVALLLSAQAWADSRPPKLYAQHCASCHGADRLGLMGPALLPENLARLKKNEALEVIRDSRPAVQMPAFRDMLAPDDIQQLADWIMTPVTPAPKWEEAEIRASRIVYFAPGSLPDKAQFSADPMNLFVVVEGFQCEPLSLALQAHFEAQSGQAALSVKLVPSEPPPVFPTSHS